MRSSTEACEAVLRDLPGRMLVGVSGGIDSVALLHALVRSSHKPVVIHFDHGWREQSSADAEWVCELAVRLGLRFAGGKMRRSDGKHRETDARSARYAFFAQVARRFKIPHLVLAHQADDQVETFLMQLLRGGGAAARGMEMVTTRGALTIHRPWLGICRKEITAYARRHHLDWREDATNADVRHRRNLIRKRILPYLRRQVSPRVDENLWRAAEIQRAESEWLDSLCAEAAEGAELNLTALRHSSVAQQRRTILRWLQQRGIKDISFTDVEAVRGLVDHRIPAKVNLSGGKFARRRSGKIFVE